MPLQLLSRPATDTVHSRSPSPLTTPTSKPSIPTIFLTSATPCDANPIDNAHQVSPWVHSEASPVPIAPKPTANGEAARRRLVPKKSKLGLLGSSSAKPREQDFSDVVRRVGGSPMKNGNSTFEIYVDPTNDPDIGEILVVKKKKSRLALDGLEWGRLGEVTNVPPTTKPKESREKGGKKESLLKLKADENQKWWSIGRGRKDSKEKDKRKDQDRASSPQPTDKPADRRTRFNSLDPGILLSDPINKQHANSPSDHQRVPTPPPETHAPTGAAGPGTGKGSVALRAMRSVRSLARIGSWAQLRSMPNPEAAAPTAASTKDKEVDGKKKKKREKREKGKGKEKEKETIRYSGSSFEAGALTASPAASKHESKSLGKKKASILGLGLPSSIRLPSTRSGSTASSIVAANTARHRLSADSATLLGGGILTRGRFGSTMSTASSLRPMSAQSCGSRQSSGSSGATSVKWDEAGLETVKETRRKDKEMRRKEKEKEVGQEKKKSKTSKDSTRRSSDSRKRTPLSAIFTGVVSEREEGEREQPLVGPTVAIEEVTRDARRIHVVAAENSPTETPVKRLRLRPVSDQPLGHCRPTPFYEGNDDNAVMSLLDAATNDLAQLINRLDLEATPGSAEMTPTSQHSPLLDSSSGFPPRDQFTAESPVKALRRKNSSIISLKAYTQSCSKDVGVQLGQNIAPWATLNASISPSKSSPSTIKASFQDNMATVRTHRRTQTPAPAADPSPAFKALRPANTRLPTSKTVIGASSGISPFDLNPNDRSSSSLTFGSCHSKSGSHGNLAASPVFKKAHRKKSCLAPHAELGNGNLPILPEARRSLGLAGTMGSSIGSVAEQDYDASDPDSDIPDELQVILSNSDQEGEDTISFDRHSAPLPLPSPGLPPAMPLPVLNSPPSKNPPAEVPVFRTTVFEDGEHHADVEETGTLSEDDTRRSFDFTGELQRLNESGASDRRSFIEQLETAFRTPAKLDLRYDFESLPPIPKLSTLHDELHRADKTSLDLPIDYEFHELSPKGMPVDVNAEPTLLPGTDTTTSDDELLRVIAPQVLPNATSVASRPSNGELNRDFKFGGKKSSPSKPEPTPLTLSDIIPPPEIARSLSMASFAGDESSLIHSILTHAVQVESPPQNDFNSSSKHQGRERARDSFLVVGHKRNSSGLSFAGFDSFTEIRRGFEFSDSRPGFYPPPATVSDRRRQKHESMYSIASISSYGNVLYGGSADPFDYGSVAPLPSLRERPSSDEFSLTMSTAVDDTFSFMRRQPRRCRLDSDASSFYFRASLVHPYDRSQRRPESGVSIGPPVSLFNRNSTYHRRSDSSTSMSSTTNLSTNCRRFSWTRHRSNPSVESTLSDFSGLHLGRPGLGDKMLESARERASPLPSISVSPSSCIPDSIQGARVHCNESDSRTSYDSIMDSQCGSQRNDSLFERTGHRSSVADSTFFEEHLGGAAAKPLRYRPISSLTIPSVHSPAKEDDTMISILGGGGRVRRCSVTSMIGASPCIQVERRKNILTNPPETVFSRIKYSYPEDQKSPEISRVIESKPSIASTTNSFKLGDERMIRAKHGLLELQSLQGTALMGDGEELSRSFQMPVFTRPSRANRSRSSTCTSTSGADTPPLSISDGHSSFSEGSRSSLDLSQLNALLSNASHPASNAAFDRARPLAHNLGHRRRISQARASRTSLYETIEEEFTSPLPPTESPETSIPGSASKAFKPAEHAIKMMDPPQVFVVDPETSSVNSFSLWDDEGGITALRRYYALRDEAEDTVTESKRTWSDTPFSIFAVQSFNPPRHRSGMEAMLEHSLQNYGPLPSDLRPHRMRSRVNSRPSPYPRTVKTSFSSTASVEHLRGTVAACFSPSVENLAPRQTSPFSNALQQLTINPNVPSTVSTSSKDCLISPGKSERVFGLRPHVGSAARRTGLGWSKKSTGRYGVENKENSTSTANVGIGATATVNVSHGTIMTPADGLRLNRPRPKGRPTPASVRPLRA